MGSKILLLLATVLTVKGSFLQSPDQFHTTFNSTFLSGNKNLFRPIIIPNITKTTEQPPTFKVLESPKPKGNETLPRKSPDLKQISQEAILGENYLDEEPKTTGNSLKFSSRYSTKEMHEDLSGEEEEKKPKEAENRIGNKTIEASPKTVVSSTERDQPLSSLSSILGDSGEEKDDTSESREAELSKIASTTNEPYSELQRPTSFRSSLYSGDDLENYETTSKSAEEIESCEEKETEDEDKGSVKDYYNSGSKNYHSIQTPLNHVKYRGAHTYTGGFEPEKIRTRLLTPMSRQHEKPSWPYSRQKGKVEELNEISDRDEIYTIDADVKKEFNTKQKQQDLEAAVEKDELRFNRNKHYNQIEERRRRKQQENSLAEEEAKDDKFPLFQSLKQYQVNEEPRYQSTSKGSSISKFKTTEGFLSSKPSITTPKNVFKTTSKKPQQFEVSSRLSENFHGKHFLGPVVFNQNLDRQKIKPLVKPKQSTTQKVPIPSSYKKGLAENEELDQENLTNQRSEKTVFKTGSQSFNHLEESDEMYNAILANIQSVFGIKTHSLKSTSHKSPEPEGNLEESRSLTWSLPLIKRTKVN